MIFPTLPPSMTLCSQPQGSDGVKRRASIGKSDRVFACLIQGARLYSAKQNEEAHTQNTDHMAANL